MRVRIVGPNLLDQSKGSFHVHAANCSDLTRMAKRDFAYRDELLNGGWYDVRSRCEVAEIIYDNGIMQEGESGLDYLFDFYFFPCCDKLVTSYRRIKMSAYDRYLEPDDEDRCPKCDSPDLVTYDDGGIDCPDCDWYVAGSDPDDYYDRRGVWEEW